MKNNCPEITQHLDPLIRLALQSGASRAGVISIDDISAENELADLCRKPQCRNYGLSASCPPHVSGPPGFKKLLSDMTCAIVVRIDVPASVLFSSERREVVRLLHEMVASVEQAAVAMGYTRSKAFAGSSCKKIFCHTNATCRVISGDGQCRHPESARPSMSGYGINVSKLMTAAGWPSEINTRQTESDAESMSWVAGLILIG